MFVENFNTSDIKFAIPKGYELDNMHKENDYIELWCSKIIEKDADDEEIEQQDFYYSKLYDFNIFPNTFFSDTDYQKAMIKKLGDFYQQKLKKHYKQNNLSTEKFNSLCNEIDKKTDTPKQTSLFDFIK